MAKKKATAKKKAAVKRAAPKPPAPRPSLPPVAGPVVGHFKDVSWEWFEDEGRFVSTIDSKRPIYSIEIDFGRSIESAKCSLAGSGIAPKVEGPKIFLRCNAGQFKAQVVLGEGKKQSPVLRDWNI